MSQKITIATRKSPLALWQAEFVKKELTTCYPHLDIQLLPMMTQGDQLLDISLSKVGGKGLFLKELEKSLLNHEADIAVHSLKDMPAELEKEFSIGAILERADARDVFVAKRFKKMSDLPEGAVIGTSSLRRSIQMKRLLPGCQIKPLRGNVGTRLRKLEEDEFDAIVLAAAGLQRLGLEEVITAYLPVESMLPAAGQGVLAIECRADDESMKALLQPLNHPLTAQLVLAERTVTRVLQGGCQSPLAVYARGVNQFEIELNAFLADPSSKRSIAIKRVGPIEEATDLGVAVAEELIAKGAKDILLEYEH